MLQTWEAAVNFSPSRDGGGYQPVDVATLIGWTQQRSDSDRPQMNRTADACNATYKLLQDGHVKRDDLADLTVNQVREICTRAQANVDRVVKTAKVHKYSAAASVGSPR